MAYEKPKCECGTELVVRVDKVAEYEYAIKKNGTLSKRCKRVSTLSQHNWGCLCCPSCHNRYEFNYALMGNEAFKFKREELL